jgi:plasmid stability protein
LDEDTYRALDARAAKAGLSVHEQARHCVLEVLQEKEDRAALREAFLHLQGLIKTLREDVATATKALLMSAGKVSPQEAHAWVTENFR